MQIAAHESSQEPRASSFFSLLSVVGPKPGLQQELRRRNPVLQSETGSCCSGSQIPARSGLTLRQPLTVAPLLSLRGCWRFIRCSFMSAEEGSRSEPGGARESLLLHIQSQTGFEIT